MIELKRDETAETAINQIKRKNYPDTLKNIAGEILLVGISYDKEKKHTCMMERVML